MYPPPPVEDHFVLATDPYGLANLGWLHIRKGGAARNRVSASRSLVRPAVSASCTCALSFDVMSSLSTFLLNSILPRENPSFVPRATHMLFDGSAHTFFHGQPICFSMGAPQLFF